jgi:hypothetical protein
LGNLKEEPSNENLKYPSRGSPYVKEVEITIVLYVVNKVKGSSPLGHISKIQIILNNNNCKVIKEHVFHIKNLLILQLGPVYPISQIQDVELLESHTE